jgi:cell wall-associated NlpC family hydrolase
MTTARTSVSNRSTRRLQRGTLALLAGAGILLTPAVAQASTTAAAPAAVAPATTAAAQTAVNVAMAQLGKPYAWGATGPGSFDCSGLTSFAYRAAGITLPRTTGDQAQVGAPVARANLQPGDLVFFYNGGHVGIYIGGNQVVHAPTAGDVVKVTNIDYMPFSSARRVA